jgi:hypothetical protein
MQKKVWIILLGTSLIGCFGLTAQAKKTCYEGHNCTCKDKKSGVCMSVKKKEGLVDHMVWTCTLDGKNCW